MLLTLYQCVYISINLQVGYTPLHLAAYQGFLDMAALLLERGAGVNRQDRVRCLADVKKERKDRVGTQGKPVGRLGRCIWLLQLTVIDLTANPW